MMDDDSRMVVRALCEEMAETKNLLRSIYAAVSPQGEAGGEDMVYQFPDSAGAMLLAGGGVYEKETAVNRRLVYISIDAPEGVIISIYRDNSLWMFSSDEIGALEFKKGVYFGGLKIRVVNTTEIAQNWSIRFIFS